MINGRIDEAGEVDRYRIAAEPGQRLLLEVEGAALGSSDLFGVLTVTTPDGEYLASSGDDIPDPDTFRLLSPTATSFDPWVVVEAPEGADELHVAVEDLVGRGGPRFGYRLTATANGPDFELRLGSAELTLNSGASKPIEVSAVRRGYLGSDSPLRRGPARRHRGPRRVDRQGGAQPRHTDSGALRPDPDHRRPRRAAPALRPRRPGAKACSRTAP